MLPPMVDMVQSLAHSHVRRRVLHAQGHFQRPPHSSSAAAAGPWLSRGMHCEARQHGERLAMSGGRRPAGRDAAAARAGPL